MRQSNYKNGFLLIELCIALGCLGIIIPSTIQLAKRITRQINDLKVDLQQLQALENNIEYWRFSGINRTNGNSDILDSGFEHLKVRHNDITFTILRQQ